MNSPQKDSSFTHWNLDPTAVDLVEITIEEPENMSDGKNALPTIDPSRLEDAPGTQKVFEDTSRWLEAILSPHQWKNEMVDNTLVIDAINQDKDQLIKDLVQKYPHLNNLSLFWGHKEIYYVIARITLQDREELRKGMAPDYLSRIYKLENMHDSAFPEYQKDKEAIYSQVRKEFEDAMKKPKK